MASPPTQSPERGRLREFIEARVEELDLTWAALSEISGVPYETIRRIRTGDRPITREIREDLEDGLQWTRGDIRVILTGGDPTPLPPSPPVALTPGPAVETSVGRVEVRIARDPSATTGGLTDDQVAEIERRLAERMRTEAPLFVELLARQMREEGEEK